MLTVVRPEIFWHNLMVRVNTYNNVTAGSEWTMEGTNPDTVGMATISLVNLPTLSGPILYSNSGYSNITFNPTDRIALLYQSPDDLDIKIQTGDSHLYKTVQNIVGNGSYSIDMSDARQTENHQVSFPLSAANYDAQLFGYKNEDYDSPIPILSDHLISDGLAVDKINLHYPPAVFSGFHTKLMLQEQYTSEDTWFYHTEGVIPGEFVKINAGILAMQPQTGSLTLQTNGNFDMVTAQWEFIDHALMFYEWQVFAPDSAQKIILPEIPPAFRKMFPTISLDSLTFQYAEITDFYSLSSYTELTRTVFNPLQPEQMDRLDASSLRKTFNAVH